MFHSIENQLTSVDYRRFASAQSLSMNMVCKVVAGCFWFGHILVWIFQHRACRNMSESQGEASFES